MCTRAEIFIHNPSPLAKMLLLSSHVVCYNRSVCTSTSAAAAVKGTVLQNADLMFDVEIWKRAFISVSVSSRRGSTCDSHRADLVLTLRQFGCDCT